MNRIPHPKAVLAAVYFGIAAMVESFWYTRDVLASIFGLALFGVVGMVAFLRPKAGISRLYPPRYKELDLQEDGSAGTSQSPSQAPPPQREATETNLSPFVGEERLLDVEIVADAKISSKYPQDITPKTIKLKVAPEPDKPPVQEEEQPPPAFPNQ